MPSTSDSLLKKNMKLFGLPYQFMPSVDPRVDTVSTDIGRKFTENIITDAPVITIIPGKPKYLPSSKNKTTITQNIINGASDSFEGLKDVINTNASEGNEFRYYDFERSYTEYMKYVNILCRTCAVFLELDNEKLDSNGEILGKYDWRNYRWNTDEMLSTSTFSTIIENMKSDSDTWDSIVETLRTYISNTDDGETTTTDETEEVEIDVDSQLLDALTTAGDSTSTYQYQTTSSDDDVSLTESFLENYNYIQFFIDMDASSNESMSNNVSESYMKQLFDSGQSLMKELSFIVNSGGADEFTDKFSEFTTDALQSLSDHISGNTTVTSTLSRVLSLTSNVVKGENVIFPDVYQSSEYAKSYSFTVHLKSPYGHRLGFYLDIVVPLMHLLALAIPKQTSGNTYGSPFLIKAYVEGVFTCNMGMVTSIAINKNPTDGTVTSDGLPTEVDVTLNIADLYSDLSMSPQSSPLLFVNNSSLIEYLLTTCGLSLISPNLQKRIDLTIAAISNAFMDIDDTITSGVQEAIDNFVINFLGLRW